MLRSGGSLLLSTPAHGRLALLAPGAVARERFDGTSTRAATTCASTRAARSRGCSTDFGFEQIECARPAGCRARGACCSPRRCARASSARRRGRARAPCRALRAAWRLRASRARARARRAPSPGRGLRARRAQRLDVVVLDLDRFGVARGERFRRDRLGVRGRSPPQLVHGGARVCARGRTRRASATSAGSTAAGARRAAASRARAPAAPRRLLHGREREQRLRGQRVARDGRLRARRARARGSRASSASACWEASAERCGCHCAHAASSAPTTTARRRAMRSGPSARGREPRARTSDCSAAGRRRAPPSRSTIRRRSARGVERARRARRRRRARAGASPQRPAAGQPAGAEQRDARVAGHVPGPVGERVDAEHDDEAEHAQHADALGRVRRRAPADGQRASSRASRRCRRDRASRAASPSSSSGG